MKQKCNQSKKQTNKTQKANEIDSIRRLELFVYMKPLLNYLFYVVITGF